MLCSVKDLEQFSIGATDGVIGGVRDFYFDDEAWVVRYLVVDAGAWLWARKVLISTHSIGSLDSASKVLSVSITKEQVKNSPLIDTDKPVSRQHEMAYLSYYNYPHYWDGTGIWGPTPYPGITTTDTVDDGAGSGYRERCAANAQLESEAAEQRKHDDPHLRSCNAVAGYQLRAADGDIGHVHGFLLDEKSWALRYLVVETSSSWSNHLVLISPEWIDDVSWEERTVTTNLTQQAVKDSPPYDVTAPLDREAEARIYRHYRFNPYWRDDMRREVA
ncbi:MAG: PRC-barrel domain-containing protein [Gammaproteobacteria bacterium]